MDARAPIHIDDAGLEFPAQRMTTPYAWEDVAFDRSIREKIEDIAARIKEKPKTGFRALFSGPPGTGKTLAACLLGKETGLPLFRIDSKWIGETEENLRRVLDHSQNQDSILFFDEADALFGKRTEAHSANDRAANQQVAYLLQRIEDFPGIVILATNLQSHLDEAFARRLQSIIRFHLPDAEPRRT